MLTFQVSGITPHNSTVPITGMMEAMISELRRLRRFDDEAKSPIVVELASDYGRVKCTVTDPEALEASLANAPQNGGQEWMVGYYVPTDAFLKMQEHTAVMDRNQGLVATCGPVGDMASMRDACLFAVSPKLYDLCRRVQALTLKGEPVASLLPEIQEALGQVPEATKPSGSPQTSVFE